MVCKESDDFCSIFAQKAKKALSNKAFLRVVKFSRNNGADGGTRTHDLLITNQLLYQLSHISIPRLSKNGQRKYYTTFLFKLQYLLQKNMQYFFAIFHGSSRQDAKKKGRSPRAVSVEVNALFNFFLVNPYLTNSA